MKKYYVGTELKLALTICNNSFNISTDPWKAIITNGKKSITYTREINSVLGEDQ